MCNGNIDIICLIKRTFDNIIIDFHAKDFCTALNIFSMQTERFSLFSSAF